MKEVFLGGLHSLIITQCRSRMWGWDVATGLNAVKHIQASLILYKDLQEQGF